MKIQSFVVAVLALCLTAFVHATPEVRLRPIAFANHTVTKASADVLPTNMPLPTNIASQITTLKFGFLLEVRDSVTNALINADELLVQTGTYSHVRYDTSLPSAVTFPNNASLAALKFNGPGDSLPIDVRAYDASGTTRSIDGNNFVGTLLTQVSSVYLTDQTVTLSAVSGNPFPLLKTEYCGESRSNLYNLSGTVKVAGTVYNWSHTNKAASVQVIQTPSLTPETINIEQGNATFVVSGDLSSMPYATWTIESTPALEAPVTWTQVPVLSIEQINPLKQRVKVNLGTAPEEKRFWRARITLVGTITPST
ncbi:MAG: hypothetical protein RL094_629 [Candidatus Parcubacteria bacterium]|jgi:hypothetical protein